MNRRTIEDRLNRRRQLWRQVREEAKALEGALTDPEADPTPALTAMARREELTGQLKTLGEPTDEERGRYDFRLSAIDDEIVAIMEEVLVIDNECALRLAKAMESMTREMSSLRGGQKMAAGYGDQKKELFARFMSKKL